MGVQNDWVCRCQSAPMYFNAGTGFHFPICLAIDWNYKRLLYFRWNLSVFFLRPISKFIQVNIPIHIRPSYTHTPPPAPIYTWLNDWINFPKYAFSLLSFIYLIFFLFFDFIFFCSTNPIRRLFWHRKYSADTNAHVRSLVEWMVVFIDTFEHWILPIISSVMRLTVWRHFFEC